jgi:hypothetical protein
VYSHDRNEYGHRVAAEAHLESAKLHERLAVLFDSVDSRDDVRRVGA